MGKSSAPAPDPRIGEAAMLSAQTGQDYLALMREQAGISNKWATEDRARYKDVFEPLQDQYIEDAQNWDSPERAAAAAAAAGATVQNQMAAQAGATKRAQMAMGVNPASGRSIETTARADTATALATAGARNGARTAVRQEGAAMRGNAINMGSGLAVNPLGSLQTSNQAYGAGFNGAMSGYGQQGQLLNTQYQQQLQSWQADQQAGSSLWGGVGSLVGAFWSDENLKENKRAPKKSPRRSIDSMRIEEWDYKDGVADGGSHIGTYAQDFQKATGKGDGRSIDVQDAIGVTMGAVKELSADMRRIERKMDGRTQARPDPKRAQDEPRRAAGRSI